MLLVIEVVLTVAAWRRGWKAWALAPVLGCAGMGVVFGILCGLNGGVEQVFVMGLVIDVICIVTLTVMAVCGRKAIVGKNVSTEQADTGLSCPSQKLHSGF